MILNLFLFVFDFHMFDGTCSTCLAARLTSSAKNKCKYSFYKLQLMFNIRNKQNSNDHIIKKMHVARVSADNPL